MSSKSISFILFFACLSTFFPLWSIAEDKDISLVCEASLASQAQLQIQLFEKTIPKKSIFFKKNADHFNALVLDVIKIALREHSLPLTQKKAQQTLLESIKNQRRSFANEVGNQALVALKELRNQNLLSNLGTQSIDFLSDFIQVILEQNYFIYSQQIDLLTLINNNPTPLVKESLKHKLALLLGFSSYLKLTQDTDIATEVLYDFIFISPETHEIERNSIEKLTSVENILNTKVQEFVDIVADKIQSTTEPQWTPLLRQQFFKMLIQILPPLIEMKSKREEDLPYFQDLHELFSKTLKSTILKFPNMDLVHAQFKKAELKLSRFR